MTRPFAGSIDTTPRQYDLSPLDWSILCEKLPVRFGRCRPTDLPMQKSRFSKQLIAFSRVSPALDVRTNYRGSDVLATLEPVAAAHGRPAHLETRRSSIQAWRGARRTGRLRSRCRLSVSQKKPLVALCMCRMDSSRRSRRCVLTLGSGSSFPANRRPSAFPYARPSSARSTIPGSHPSCRILQTLFFAREMNKRQKVGSGRGPLNGRFWVVQYPERSALTPRIRAPGPSSIGHDLNATLRPIRHLAYDL